MASHESNDSIFTPSDDLHRQVEEYPWDHDMEFQRGLKAILRSPTSREQAQELTLRARCFYYKRKHNIPVDFDAYKVWRQKYHLQTLNIGVSPCSHQFSARSASSTADSDPNAPYPTTFAQIVDLITTGKPIPGIKDIPNIVLKGQETPSMTAKRKKPWE